MLSLQDRKEQRSSFRDILRGVEEGDPPSEKVSDQSEPSIRAIDQSETSIIQLYYMQVKFGQEVLFLDSWYKKLQYDWFCKVSLLILELKRAMCLEF